MIQFFVPDIEETLALPETESGHCARVLRMTTGDTVYCVDGKGHRYRCRITAADNRHVAVEILETEALDNHWSEEIVLAVAPTKNMDRMEWMVEKCTEIGVNRIIPVKCRHSERKELKTARLHKIVVSAMKQSLKGRLPLLDEMTPVEQVLRHPFSGQKFICYCADDVSRRSLVKEYIPGSDVVVLIGPEGDFSQEEVHVAMENGWIPVTLGDSRLRTETAGVVAVTGLHVLNQMKN